MVRFRINVQSHISDIRSGTLLDSVAVIAAFKATAAAPTQAHYGNAMLQPLRAKRLKQWREHLKTPKAKPYNVYTPSQTCRDRLLGFQLALCYEARRNQSVPPESMRESDIERGQRPLLLTAAGACTKTQYVPHRLPDWENAKSPIVSKNTGSGEVSAAYRSCATT
ncbi:hypothetical protein NDU88_001529 [Pleurodeles waltl]|uniref:Uncharacterized protein n=1 Tax=Pleurodeles waltl TaxID=8319 RepID=A0AAV7WL56_PLEWA|nr:hypothetical protein NDU88_001529 [Pleurodeles waltl]